MFNELRCVWCTRGTYGATLAEILHNVLLKLCDYIAEGKQLMLTDSVINLLYVILVDIYQD